MSGVSSTSEKHSEVVGQQEKVHSPLHKGHFFPLLFFTTTAGATVHGKREREKEVTDSGEDKPELSCGCWPFPISGCVSSTTQQQKKEARWRWVVETG